MKPINRSYTTYCNVKRKRAGHLLPGRYQAILVDADAYATELSRSIHLNPVGAGIVAAPEDYPWRLKSVITLSSPLSAGNETWQDISGKGKINYSTVIRS